MKKLSFCTIVLSFIILGSCKNKVDETEQVVETDAVISTECYLAVYEKDTLDLTVTTLKSGKVSGNLEMRIFEKPSKNGKIEGGFSGDTLFADYTFVEKVAGTTYKNPLALLKKENRLILGNGQIQTTMGVSYLVKDVPIDFDKVKYKFSVIDCK